MRKIIASHWMTLDGYIGGPDGEMDFVGKFFNDEMATYESDLVDTADTLILGRLTYESFAGSWPKVPENPDVSEDERAYARKLNAMKKVVFSRTLEAADWTGSTLHRDIDAEDIQQLKAAPGKDMLLYGSATIVHALTDLGLIDEYQILVHPTLIGTGKPLFKNSSSQRNFKLSSTRTFKSGVIGLYYSV